MEKNFDLKKYDKKVALNYNYLAGKNAESFSSATWALYGETCHFFAGQKFPENEKKLLEIISDGLNELNNLSITELAESLITLTEYSVATGDERALACAERVALTLEKKVGKYSELSPSDALTRATFPEGDGKRGENKNADTLPEGDGGKGENKNANAIAEECGACDEKCFAIDALSGFCCAVNDQKAKQTAQNLLNEFFCACLNFEYGESADNSFAYFETLSNKLTPEGLTRLSRGALNFAVLFENEKLKKFAADALNYCLIKGLSLNYAAKNSFKNAKFTSAAATSILFSLCLKFYKITGDNKYSYFARRIWYNGLQFCQRIEGGAGEDSVVSEGDRILQITRYLGERDGGYIAEALAAYLKNKQIFAEAGGEINKDKSGRILMGDKIFVRDESGFFGKDLIEIPTMTAFDKEVALQLKLKL